MLVSKRCAIVFSKWGKFLHSWGKRCAMGVGQVHVRWGKLARRVVFFTRAAFWKVAIGWNQDVRARERERAFCEVQLNWAGKDSELGQLIRTVGDRGHCRNPETPEFGRFGLVDFEAKIWPISSLSTECPGILSETASARLGVAPQLHSLTEDKLMQIISVDPSTRKKTRRAVRGDFEVPKLFT